MSTTEHIAEDLRPLAQPIDLLKLLPGNPRRGDIEAVMRSYDRFGQRKPIVARRDGTVIAGNHQLQAAQRLGWSHIAVVWTDDDDLTAKAFALADNRIGDLGNYDFGDLEAMLAEVRLDPLLLSATGFAFEPVSVEPLGALDNGGFAQSPSLPGDTEADAPAVGSLAERFVISPFSVLDARSGPWLERKRRWLAYGIRSEIGRGGDLLHLSDTVLEFLNSNKAVPGGGGGGAWIKSTASGERVAADDRYRSDAQRAALTLPSLSGRVPTYYEQKNAAEKQLGRALANEEFERDFLDISGASENLSTNGTSIFDPVLCELVYRWWSPPGGVVLDPFAGGSVRGVVAGLLGRRYVGVELRAEQVEANRQQAQEIIPGQPVEWVCGDSRALLPSVSLPAAADLLFSCPPYADLEVYSDDPADISNMPYDEFLAAYRDIIAAGVERLANDRFACIVIGDVRDRRGHYRGLIGETVRAFADAGCSFYNEAILVTPVGSLPVRVGRQFAAGRKLGKTHQNVLVFVKGDGARAAAACGEVDVTLPDGMLDDAMPTADADLLA
jgi:DNA modification methylase